ncbi:MAG: DUF4474 domain-containing protein [Oscillospiraceae bacterium]|jgi:hypothetical protein|nr:DUF4474 domain-containing protein [Oscillospiraceae bacterium]
MSKSNSLRNAIIGAVVAVLVVGIGIPVTINMFPWQGYAGSPPTEGYTVEQPGAQQPVDAPVVQQQEVDPPAPAVVDPPAPPVEPAAPATDPLTDPATQATTTTTQAATTTTTKPTTVTTTKPTTTKPVTTTKPTTTAAKTTKPATTLPVSTGKPNGTNQISHIDGAVAAPVNGEEDKREILSYKMNPVDNYFYTEQEAWQRPFGFMRAYDEAAPIIVMFYDTTRIKFTYDGWDWMIQFWKGQYGWMFLGSEVGVYRTKEGKGGRNAHYNSVPNEAMPNMTTALFNKGEYQAKRPYGPYWWCTIFVPGYLDLNKDRSQLRVEMVIEMFNAEMADAFENALLGKNDKGFHPSGKTYDQCIKSGFDHTDVYARKGTKFAINWLSVKDECNFRYDDPFGRAY